MNTIVGALVILLSVVVPGTPGTRDTPGPDAPPGWRHNPSSWSQRAGIVGLALAQLFAARHMAAFQLGHVPEVWDPFFGDGTRRVLTSSVSESFPISDAGLGAVSYLVEALTGVLGGTRRWRTMPWAVLLFGVMVVPVGVVSVVLIVLQPVVVGAWCTLCLFTAALTVLMVAPAADEVVAAGQFLGRARREGQSLWSALWKGDTQDVYGGEAGEVRERSLGREILDGMELSSATWALVACAALGIWQMASPAVMGTTGRAADSDHLAGALIVTFAAIGFGEAVRAARLVNVLLGAWVIASPWVLGGATALDLWADGLVGVLVIVLSVRRGPVEGRFGSWDRYVV